MRYQNSISFTPKPIVQNTKRILIIEQSELIGRQYKSILRQRGYTILTATNGSKAIELLDSFQPNLIITTDMLLDMESNQLRKSASIHCSKTSTPILVLSAEKMAQLYSLYPSTHSIETLFLPFRIKDFRASVQRLLDTEEDKRRYFYYPSNPKSSTYNSEAKVHVTSS